MIRSTFYSLRKLLLVSGVILASGNSRAEEAAALNIVTVNYPLKFFAESITKGSATVNLPMPVDIDPAFWSPKADDVSALQKADVVLLNGANYAKWLPKVSLSLFKMVNTSSQFSDQFIPIESAMKHNHGVGGEHSHTGNAFTTWLDFSLAEQQATAIFKALSKKTPNLSASYVTNFIPLQESLLAIDAELTQIGSSLKGKPLLGSHPVYQYLKKRYQLNLQSVHWEPEDAPSKEQWETLKKILKKHPAKWMLWEGKPAPETVTKLEALGVKSIVFTPCANKPEKGDFLSVMKMNTENLKAIVNEK
ncbi:MAG: zinc ABC transporter substrate-binding protein [Methylococcales bacterium]|nr:zinc ABC transporter substrate-binding protein [Methylococcales bacterium]